MGKKESVRGTDRVRDASRILYPERESVCGAVCVRDASRRERKSGSVIYASRLE